MSFCVTIFGVSEINFPFIFLWLLYLGFLKSSFLSSFCVAMSDFRYHYLSTSFYMFVISVVIVKNDLENKIIYVFNVSKNLCTKFILYYHLIILKYYPTQYVEKPATSHGL
jgi:hypothetical protein